MSEDVDDDDGEDNDVDEDDMWMSPDKYICIGWIGI